MEPVTMLLTLLFFITMGIIMTLVMVQSRNYYEWEGDECVSGTVNVAPENWSLSFVPDENQTNLVAGLIVQRSVLNPRQISLAGNESETIVGVLVQDQYQYQNGTWDTVTPLKVVISGYIRLSVGEAINEDLPWTSDATGRAKLWTNLMAAAAMKGYTKSRTTVVGEIAEATLNHA